MKLIAEKDDGTQIEIKEIEIKEIGSLRRIC